MLKVSRPGAHIRKIILTSAASAALVMGAPAALWAANAASTTPAVAPAATQADAVKPMQDLTAAAQRLRDATHDMIREQNTTQRDAAIRQVDKTLQDVEDAMMSLPPSVLLAGTKEKASTKSAENLARAADRLNDAVGALKTDASAGKQAQSLDDIKQALAQIHRERTDIALSAPAASQAAASSNTAK